MHGAIVSRPLLSDSCTAGAARSTSHVVKMTFAPSEISLSAQLFETAALSPCVSQVLITSGCPSTPPFALICATRICAAANAGPSNGAIGPVESCAQPITIGEPADVRAAAVAATTSAAATTPRSPILLTCTPLRERSCRHPPFLPALHQLLPAATNDRLGVLVPQRVGIRGAERAVVGEHLDVVEAVPAGPVERGEDGRNACDAVSGKDAIRPAARRFAPVVHVHAGDERCVSLDLVEQLGRVPEMPDVELDAERGRADLVDEGGRVAQCVQRRPLLDALGLEWLDGDTQAEALGLARDLAEAADRGVPVAGAGKAQDGRRLEAS